MGAVLALLICQDQPALCPLVAPAFCNRGTGDQDGQYLAFSGMGRKLVEQDFGAVFGRGNAALRSLLAGSQLGRYRLPCNQFTGPVQLGGDHFALVDADRTGFCDPVFGQPLSQGVILLP